MLKRLVSKSILPLVVVLAFLLLALVVGDPTKTTRGIDDGKVWYQSVETRRFWSSSPYKAEFTESHDGVTYSGHGPMQNNLKHGKWTFEFQDPPMPSMKEFYWQDELVTEDEWYSLKGRAVPIDSVTFNVEIKQIALFAIPLR